jgi:F-type H+-transporting ATPase subunit b
MRRLRLFGGLMMLAMALSYTTPYARAQERPSTQTDEQGDPWIWWKLVNFAILVGVLGYLMRKPAAEFFKSRTQEIERGISEGEKAKREGEERVAEVERRLAGLGAEIERLRANMRQEMTAEGERIRLETERHIHRIEEQATQEIDSMLKAARRELKLYAADLAVTSAEEQLKGRVTRDVENTLVSSFIDQLRTKGTDRSINN